MNTPRFLSHLSYAFQTFVLRHEMPYLLILVVTDTCNLDCFYCESKNSGRYHMSFLQVREALASSFRRGCRTLVVTGGEPTLWRDGGKNLDDLIGAAFDAGYVDVSVYTNGTNPLSSRRCKYIVTIDGTREIHNSIRSGSYDRILRNIRTSASSEIYAAVTVSRSNAACLEEIIHGMAREGVFRSITFNLLTHCPEIVRLHGFAGSERTAVLDRIWDLKKKGYPVYFSRAAYRAMRANDWKRPIPQIELATRDRQFMCCRDVGNPDVCANCGYSGCVEVSQLLSLKPSAILELFRTGLCSWTDGTPERA
ncbi:MAG TPA: radical SAM protein [Syntrophales bacterium]|nr:radical SAM protein [Syntrophales bacterium]